MVFSRSMDMALLPLTRAAAKLGTYGEALPPGNIYAQLTSFSPAAIRPSPLPAVTWSGTASAGGAADPPFTSSRSAATITVAALAGATPEAVAAAPPPINSSSTVDDGGGTMALDELPRRKLKRRNLGGWDWPPGQGAPPAYDVLEETR